MFRGTILGMEWDRPQLERFGVKIFSWDAETSCFQVEMSDKVLESLFPLEGYYYWDLEYVEGSG